MPTAYPCTASRGARSRLHARCPTLPGAEQPGQRPNSLERNEPHLGPLKRLREPLFGRCQELLR